MSKVHFRVRKTPTCGIASCARPRPALKIEHEENIGLCWRSECVMKHQTHSDYNLFKKHSRLFLILQIKHGGCHTQRNTQTNSAPSSGMWKTRGLFSGFKEKEMRQKRQKWHWRECVCLVVYNHVCMRVVLLFLFFLPVCSFICPSVCVSVNLTVCSVHLCWIWTASAECFLCEVCFPLLWLGKYSSVWIWVPALWSQIILNTVKSAKHAPRVDANHRHDPV